MLITEGFPPFKFFAQPCSFPLNFQLFRYSSVSFGDLWEMRRLWNKLYLELKFIASKNIDKKHQKYSLVGSRKISHALSCQRKQIAPEPCKT